MINQEYGVNRYTLLYVKQINKDLLYSTGNYIQYLIINYTGKESGKEYCCCCSVTQSCLTLGDPMDCSAPGFPVLHCLQSLLKFMSIESVMPSNHLILCRPLSFCLQSFLTSGYFPMSWLFASGGQGINTYFTYKYTLYINFV